MCRFNFPFSGASDSLMSRAKTAIENAGGAFNGNETNGTFQVKTPLGIVGGEYGIVEHEISIYVSNKPFLLSCKRIEKELSKVMR